MDESPISKRNCKAEAEADRLSDLPDSLLLVILSLLEMKDVVRTTILSKRWKDVWTTVPCLHFSGENNPSFIDAALAKWKSDKIFEFSIRFRPSNFRDSWLLLPIEKQVENLCIHIQRNVFDPKYCAPQPLNSCSSITTLCLHCCDLKIEENVQWNQLKSLQIRNPIYLSGDAINRILSGAPLLEELMLLYWNISENVNIRSTSLKILKIKLYTMDDADFIENTPVLKIRAPNLQSLGISGLLYPRISLKVPSLTIASLGFDALSDFEALYYYYTLNIKEMFKTALLGLSHVQKLTVNEWAIKLFVDEMKQENCVRFPKLEMLIFEQDEHSYYWGSYCYSLPPNRSFPSLSLSLLQLKTIVITSEVYSYSIFTVIEILLENARALKKMVIRLRNHEAYPEEYILALEKMMSMRRASPYVEVTISKI